MQEVYSKVTNHLLLPLLHKAPGNSSSYPTKSAWESKCLWVRVDGCFRSPSWDPLPVPYQKQLQFRINLGDWRSQSTTLFIVHHNGSAFSYLLWMANCFSFKKPDCHFWSEKNRKMGMYMVVKEIKGHEQQSGKRKKYKALGHYL